MINRAKLLEFINKQENIYGMSHTYSAGWIRTEDLLKFMSENDVDRKITYTDRIFTETIKKLIEEE